MCQLTLEFLCRHFEHMSLFYAVHVFIARYLVANMTRLPGEVKMSLLLFQQNCTDTDGCWDIYVEPSKLFQRLSISVLSPM